MRYLDRREQLGSTRKQDHDPGKEQEPCGKGEHAMPDSQDPQCRQTSLDVDHSKRRHAEAENVMYDLEHRPRLKDNAVLLEMKQNACKHDQHEGDQQGSVNLLLQMDIHE